ncbi:MAG: hypothetical protein R3Y49_00450 [Rikenellaceae bacterium]
MERRSVKFLVSLLGVFLLSSCTGEFDSTDALMDIQSLEEFSVPFCAPLHVGEEVVTGEWYKNPEGYVKDKYGALLDAGLVESLVKAKNSWRALVSVKLTPKGEELFNKKRTEQYRSEGGDDDVYFVQVCTLVPEKVLSVKELGDDRVELTYSIMERGLTPFGVFLDFAEGREHIHSRIFKRGTFSWSLEPIE